VLVTCKIDLTTMIERKAQQAFSEIDNEIIMLHIEKAEYFNLDIIASCIWKFIDSPKTFKEILTMLVDTYEVTFSKCKKDTEEFLITLYQEDLITFNNA